MSNYIFLDLPLYGHVNPTLAVVQELVKRGHHVSYYLPERFRRAIEATGATFHSYQSEIKSRWVMDASGLLRRLPASLVDESRQVLPQVLERIRAEQPDCLVYDHACIWGHIVAQVLNIPAIAWYPFYVMDERIFPTPPPIWTSSQPGETKRQETDRAETNMRSVVQGPLGQSHLDVSDGTSDEKADWENLCQAYHVPPAGPRGEVIAQLKIVFLPKEWQPNGHLFNEHYLFVGPSILPRHEESDFPFDQLSDTVPILYISLGTIFNDWPQFFKMCFEAFGEWPWQVVLSKGELVDLATLGSVPDNFLVATSVPQLEILSRTHVFLTHAGMNSTMESLSYGVPMVAIPQNFEQAMTAHRIAHMALGIMLERKTVNAATLRKAVERVANEASFRQRAQIMQRITRRQPSGYQRAADVLIQFAQEQVKGRESPSNAHL